MEGLKEIIVGMADFKTAKEGEVLTTILGSCVGLCLYSPKHKVGGLLHLMMASAGAQAMSPTCKKAKYADTGVPELIRSLKVMHGASSTDLIAKMFGGAKVLQGVERNIGGENSAAVKTILLEYGIPLKALKLGGEKGYRIKFAMDTGKVACQIFGQIVEEF
ncbi:MAG: chemotaxis protein CheD [Candidatus Omnitrophica bacterium]|nr:chemotaxis protein CheD [Candidatus Omnitrophota bacterium]